jgi:hypothetical protein
MRRKAQAAMEFLMTYGWAILVVLAAIGALAYFGVLSPDRFLPVKCTMPSGVACLDHRYTGSAIQMVIQNSAGFDMTGVTVSVNGTGCVGTDSTSGPTLTNGQKATYSITCSPTAGKFKGDVILAYTNQATSMPHSDVGEIIEKIP